MIEKNFIRRRPYLSPCSYCGGTAFYRFKNGNYCCGSSTNKCPAIREKMSRSNKGRISPMKGKKHTLETRKKMSENHKGIRNYMYGKSHTEESKRKMSEWHTGKVLSEEHKRKIGASGKGKVISEAHKKKISEANKGKVVSLETRRKISGANRGRRCSEETKQKISKANSGTNNYMYGKTHSEKTKEKIRQARKRQVFSEETRRKLSASRIGRISPMKGKKHTLETRKKMSRSQTGRKQTAETCMKMMGNNNPNWKGGITHNLYCGAFADQEYKKSIRERDDNKCQNPNCRGKCKHLCIHHIDFDKQNCTPQNLVTVCSSCNSRANFNRSYWTEFYQNILSEKYGYIYN